MRYETLFFVLFFVLFLVACAPQPEKAECLTDADCVPAQCCHATSCVPEEQSPNCEGVFCTTECKPGTIDCGGGCYCQNNKCAARLIGE